jgi:hypothetical protein
VASRTTQPRAAWVVRDRSALSPITRALIPAERRTDRAPAS